MSSGKSSCYFSYLKLLLGAFWVGLVLWLLMVGTSKNGGAKTTSIAAPPARTARDQAGQAKVANRSELDPNSTRKVKVPKGPDPIHNRRMGIKGRAPRQA